MQAGGDFDVDYDVMDPVNAIILHGNAETGGDFAFTGESVGEYSFCFSNAMSTFEAKVIDLDITVEHESRFSNGMIQSDLAKNVGSINSQDKAEQNLLKSTLEIQGRLKAVSADIAALQRVQRSLRSEEHRNISLVKSIESRLFWIGIIGSFIMIAMAVGQVYSIQLLFKSGYSRL